MTCVVNPRMRKYREISIRGHCRRPIFCRGEFVGKSHPRVLFVLDCSNPPRLLDNGHLIGTLGATVRFVQSIYTLDINEIDLCKPGRKMSFKGRPGLASGGSAVTLRGSGDRRHQRFSGLLRCGRIEV